MYFKDVNEKWSSSMIIVNGTLHGYKNKKEPSPCVSCVFTLSLKAKVVHMRHWAFSSHPLGIMKWYLP